MTRSRTTAIASIAAVCILGVPAFRAAATPPRKNGEIAFSTLVHGRSQVFTVNPDGTRLRQITHRATGAGKFGLSWSPDGTGLLFTVTDTNGKDMIAKSNSNGSDVTPVSPPCTGTCLGDDEPTSSPNGRMIVFERAFGPIVHGYASIGAIFRMNLDGSDLTRLTEHRTPTTAEDHHPRWSPDGTKIAFVRFNTTASPSGRGAIEVMNADGSDVRRLTPWAIDATNPHWSPDGSKILFNSYSEAIPGKSANLFTMNTDGTHRVALTHYEGGSLQAFADDWSPNGAQIVFRRVVYSGTDTQVGAFYVMDGNGQHIRRLARMRVTTDSSRAAWGTGTG
ncbi:MAG TPA: hypothetical protein VEH79_00865 [Gaiellaceae bacterium]|nr:hypothetical protein [Gaiellaceae bacterium]